MSFFYFFSTEFILFHFFRIFFYRLTKFDAITEINCKQKYLLLFFIKKNKEMKKITFIEDKIGSVTQAETILK